MITEGSIKKQRQAYCTFMGQEDSDNIFTLFEQEHWPAFLGGEKFVSEQNLLTARRGHGNVPRDVAIYLCRGLRNDTLKKIGKLRRVLA